MPSCTICNCSPAATAEFDIDGRRQPPLELAACDRCRRELLAEEWISLTPAT